MAGYGSQTDYEADLLATYLRRGRVSPIAKRDVDLALSIYKMPNLPGNVRGERKQLNYANARRYAKGKNDSAIMKVAVRTVLNKNLADRKAAAAAGKPTTGTSAAAPAGAYRPLIAVPPPAPPAQPSYSGPLTPTPMQHSAPQPVLTIPKPSYTPRKPRFGGGGFTPR